MTVDQSLRLSSAALGAAGEYLVMSELLMRGYISALAPIGVPNIDILVTDRSGGTNFSMQVKTTLSRAKGKSRRLSRNNEAVRSEGLFYAFVGFGFDFRDPSRIYIIPSRAVACAVRDDHAAWLSGPGRGGSVRKDNDVRKFPPNHRQNYGNRPNPYDEKWIEPYLDRWDLLPSATS